ncbi:hypothetical protein GBN33_12285 [Plesiomonas shigelloides]|nr:hypothetical protein GBN33_12285 [Plesiomonas shigelloides]
MSVSIKTGAVNRTGFFILVTCCVGCRYTLPAWSCSGVGYARLPQSHSLPMLTGIHSLAAYLQLQVVWVYIKHS